MRKKISLVGSGNIGGTLAHLIALKELGDITLIDIVKGVPQGKALDLAQSSSVELFDVNIEGSNNYSSLKNSDVVIITAGIPRLPGMSRDDLLETNTKIISTIGKAVKKYCPKAFLICITNPLDAMVSILQSSSKVKHHMCVGMAGILDSSRMKYFLSKALNVSIKSIDTFVYFDIIGTPFTLSFFDLIRNLSRGGSTRVTLDFGVRMLDQRIRFAYL